MSGLATACIDLSDGLLADLGHLVRQSGVGASLRLADLPASAALSDVDTPERWDLQLCGGEDFELCFTVSPKDLSAVVALGEALGLRVTDVGVIEAETGVRCVDPDGREHEPTLTPWEHFAEPRTADVP